MHALVYHSTLKSSSICWGVCNYLSGFSVVSLIELVLDYSEQSYSSELNIPFFES